MNVESIFKCFPFIISLFLFYALHQLPISAVCLCMAVHNVNDVFSPFQVIVHLQLVVGIAVLLTIQTSMFLEGTILTMMSQEAQKMKTTHCSESFGGTTLPQAAGSKFEQRATCPQSWRPCQVEQTFTQDIIPQYNNNMITVGSTWKRFIVQSVPKKLTSFLDVQKSAIISILLSGIYMPFTAT